MSRNKFKRALVDRANRITITKEEIEELSEDSALERRKRLEAFGGISTVCNVLDSSPVTGIAGSNADLEERIALFGNNELPAIKLKSFFYFIWEALQDTTLIILQIAALISIALAMTSFGDEEIEEYDPETNYDWIEGTAILGSVIVVVIVTACNNYSKERQFRGLQTRIRKENKTAVIRHGELMHVPSEDIVVGDLCQIKYGDILTADGIIVKSFDLKCDESSLTGESEQLPKDSKHDPFVFSGTEVTEGSGRIIIIAVGLNSKAGQIYALLAKHAEGSQDVVMGRESTVSTSKSSILQTKLTRLAIQIGYAGSAVAVLTVLILVGRFCVTEFIVKEGRWQMSHANELVKKFIIGVTVLVVAVPEGLPLAVTISLAYSVKKMMRDNNLVRHLDACETMGNATTICTDKTGTLTTNRMTVVQLYTCGVQHSHVPSPNKIPKPVLEIICNAISINSSYSSYIIEAENDLIKQIGNKTECALLGLVRDLGYSYMKIRKVYPEDTFAKVYPFNSERKSMSTVVETSNGTKGCELYSKGAADLVIEKCESIAWNDGNIQPLTNAIKNMLLDDVIESMASDGLRTIAIAHRSFVGKKSTESSYWNNEKDVVNKMTLLCIVGIEDPVRPEVPQAIKKCQRAGIVVRMVTGDNMTTACSIAKKCGILDPAHNYIILEGKNFNSSIRDESGKIQQSLVDQIWPKLRVLARSTPTDKYNLVNGIIESHLSSGREVVAVTGDGTNDAPALKRADIGFAMGIAGTEIAKEASDIVITDDNFTSIVKAVMWGRNVYDNIGRFIQFQLTVNIVAVFAAFIGACVISASPLKAVQMLWVNLIMDTLASLALATERPTPELLQRKPYGRQRPIISSVMYKNIIGQALYQLTIILFIIFYGEKFFDFPPTDVTTISDHYTIVFNTFVFMTLFNELNARKIHGERNIFKGVFSNYAFCGIWTATCFLQVIIIEYGSIAFSTVHLNFEEWNWCLFFGIGTLLWGQMICCLNMKRPSKLKEVSGCRSPLPKFRKRNESAGRILWLRGPPKVLTQIRVVNQFYAILRESQSKKSTVMKKER